MVSVGAANTRCRSYTTASGRDVRLAIWSEPENIDQLDWAMQSLKVTGPLLAGWVGLGLG